MKNVSEIKDVKAEALKEVEEERFNKAKRRYKELLKSKASAVKVVANIDREIAELDLELSQDG